MEELLALFKKSIGDFSKDAPEADEYYTTFLTLAKAQLAAEDISDYALDTDLGQFAIILCAKLIMQEQSTADNSTLILLRNALTALTKGDRHDNG